MTNNLIQFVGTKYGSLAYRGENHTGEPTIEFGYVYRILCPDSTVLKLVIWNLQTSKQIPYFRNKPRLVPKQALDSTRQDLPAIVHRRNINGASYSEAV